MTEIQQFHCDVCERSYNKKYKWLHGLTAKHNNNMKRLQGNRYSEPEESQEKNTSIFIDDDNAESIVIHFSSGKKAKITIS